MTTATKPITITFEHERDTKNKQRFQEVKTDHIGSLYVGKDTVAKLGNPTTLTVTLGG